MERPIGIRACLEHVDHLPQRRSERTSEQRLAVVLHPADASRRDRLEGHRRADLQSGGRAADERLRSDALSARAAEQRLGPVAPRAGRREQKGEYLESYGAGRWMR
ncbi:MAG: hypothetical protein ACRDVF_01190 [Microbacterium sp.]